MSDDDALDRNNITADSLLYPAPIDKEGGDINASAMTKATVGV